MREMHHFEVTFEMWARRWLVPDVDGVDLLYAAGLLLSLSSLRSNGYVQPDEWFQSVELAARDVLGKRVWVAWEWGGSDDPLFGDGEDRWSPCRSASFPLYAAHLPLLLLRAALGGGARALAAPGAVEVAPRAAALAASLAQDAVLGRLWRRCGLSADEARVAVALRRCSWAAALLEARPFSNGYEALFVALAGLFAVDGRALALGALTAVGVWCRFSFAAFAAPLGLHAVAVAPSRAAAVAEGAAGFLAVAFLLVALDTAYFADVAGGAVVVAPYRNFRFNADAANLARFGLHPRWTHAFVNLPLLYLPILRYVRPPATRNGRAVAASAALGLAALSVAPHQEPRFLLPTGAAVYALAAPAVAALPRRRRLLLAWCAFHAAQVAFWGRAHQAGVVPLVKRLAAANPPGDAATCAHVLFLGTYLPPRSLSGPGDGLMLHDFENDVAGFGRRLDALLGGLGGLPCRAHAFKVAVAEAADKRPLVDALAARRAFLAHEAAFAPHFSGEILPRRFADLALGLYDVRGPDGAPWLYTPD